jgi:LuxR family maltose regulon positive regulatory protein
MDLCRVGNSKTALAWAYQVQILYLVARGDLIAAEAAALEANRLVQDGEIPIWLRCGITGLLSGVYLRMGKISEAEQVLRSRQITSDGDIEHPYQTEYFSLARLFLLKGELEPASQLLDRLLDWARTAKQVGWMIAIQISRSLVYQARGDHRRALETFDDALALGEPEGYIQTFLDPGKEQHNLLAEAARRGAHREYARRLLAVIPGSTIHPPQGEEGREINQRLRDPLSEREMQVVQWIAAGLTNKEIAQKLCVSVRTVKYYSTSIFTKLDVTGRAQAAIRARELEILK